VRNRLRPIAPIKFAYSHRLARSRIRIPHLLWAVGNLCEAQGTTSPNKIIHCKQRTKLERSFCMWIRCYYVLLRKQHYLANYSWSLLYKCYYSTPYRVLARHCTGIRHLHWCYDLVAVREKVPTLEMADGSIHHDHDLLWRHARLHHT